MKANYPLAKQFLILLLITDSAFWVIHFLLVYTPFISNWMFGLGTDRGYAEFFQYIKFFWISILLFYLGLVEGRLYFIWSLFFGVLLMDDSLSIHEKVGELLAERFNWSGWMFLRAVDFGEIAYALFMAGILLGVMLLALKQGSIEFRRFSQRTFGLLLILAFFAVVVDMIHVIAGNLPPPFGDRISNLLLMVEDGGEMMVVSFILCHSFVQLSVAELNKSLRQPSHIQV